MDRQVLLPPYMEDGPAWTQLVEAIDAVFLGKVDNPTEWLGQLRDTWILTAASKTALEDETKIISNTGFESIEKNILIRQANMLGFDFVDSDLLSADDYQRIVRNIALYWYGKGTFQFAHFLGFVLNTPMEIVNLWSTQGLQYDTYGPFLPEGDPGIGTPIWEVGGTWFPTTHVNLQIDASTFADVSFPRIVALFYSIANYNLVLNAIDFIASIYIHSVDEVELARIVVAVPGATVIETPAFIGYPAPTNTVAPAVTGTLGVGDLLTCSTGTWTGSPVGYLYSWYRGATLIGSGNTHTIVGGDVGQVLRCDVVAYNITVDYSSVVSSNTVTP
jgi:hypothetical protein